MAEHWSDIGANRVMLEGKYLYRMIDLQDDFSAYHLIILPDTIRLNPELAKRLQVYLNGGGKIFATGKSGLMLNQDCFALNFGADFKGENPFAPITLYRILILSPATPHVMYGQGYLIELNGGKSDADRCNPYFNRDITHFCSHQHTPNEPDTAGPAVSITNNTAYVSWDIFSDYAQSGSLHLKELAVHMIDRLLSDQKTIKTNLPDRAITTLTYQEKQNRYINHMLFAHTTVRGSYAPIGGEAQDVEVIEDIVPLYNIDVVVVIQTPKSCAFGAPRNRISFHV